MAKMKACWKPLGSTAVLIVILILGPILPETARAAHVDVYGEGVYTEGTLTLDVYADINSENLISYGVKVTYNPDEVSVTQAEKNENVWFFGNESGKYPYADPDTSTLGEVVILGGKLNTDTPTAGVTGKKVLLGKVYFNRKTGTLPTFTLSLGKSNNFKNFVTTGNSILDDLSGTVNFGAVTLAAGPADPSTTPDPSTPTTTTGGEKSSSGNLCFITTLF